MTVRKWRRKLADGSHSEKWAVDIYLHRPDGTTKRVRQFPKQSTRAAAERLEREIIAAFYQDVGRPAAEAPPPEAPTLVDFWDDFFLTHVVPNNKPSEQTAKSVIFRCHLKAAFGHLKLDAITSRDIESYKAHKLTQLGYAPKSINNQLAVLRSLLNVAKRWMLISQVPEYRELKVAETKVQFLTADQTRRLAEAAQPQWRSMIVFCLNTGLRIGELIALQWGDVNLASSSLLVQRNAWREHLGSPKGGKNREVALNAAAMAALHDTVGLSPVWVFPHADGSRLSHAMCRRPLQNSCKYAGLPTVQWHALRHTFASHLVASGTPLRAVQRLLGHANYGTTERYAHLAPRALHDAVDSLTLG